MEATNVTKVFDDDNFPENRSGLGNDVEHCKSYENAEILVLRTNNNSRCGKNESERESISGTESLELISPLEIIETPEEEKRSSNFACDSHEKSQRNGEFSSSTNGTEIKNSPVHNSPAPLAFTIDFGNNKEVDTARYQNLFQRYNARHRKNLSTSKIEMKQKNVPISTSANFSPKQKAPSAHSEGYFSSEDDTRRKADKLSQKLKELGLRAPGKSQGAMRKSDAMSRSYNEQTQAENSRENLSLELNNCSRPNASNFNQMSYSATMNDLSGLQRGTFDVDNDDNDVEDVNERKNRVQYSPEKKYTKNIEYIEINHDYEEKECLDGLRQNSCEKLSNINCNFEYCRSNEFGYSDINQSAMQTSSVSFTAGTNADDSEKMNLDIFNVSNADAGSDDTVSEAGTYTIHKDYTDEEKARMDIDKAFSVGVITERESEESYVHHFKMTNTRDTNTWISEWATQVAEHNSLPPPIGGSTGRTPPLTPSKIPSPIYSRSQRSRNRYEQSDSSLDMETHLHIKERLGTGLSQHTNLIDSGGESDEDTSNSYVTPPLSSQRTPTHGPSLVRRGSLSETLLKRANANEPRRSMRKYVENKIKKDDSATKSPSHALACLHLERSSSLDRKEYTSDTAESNSSRKSSLKNYTEENFKHTSSPIFNRLRPSTPKLNNSPILVHKEISTKVINSPILDKTKNVQKISAQSQNVGYFTCTENSPYMLRKSNSTSNYHDETSLHRRKELTSNAGGAYHNSPTFQRSENIQRSSSNASIRNTKMKSVLTRRSSFNNENDRLLLPKGKFNHPGSDSSSEAGESPSIKPAAAPISSGIKLNRAFSIRRGRLSCESDTTPNTTPEERRRKGQTEIKSAPCSARQTNHYRARTSSAGANSKDVFKKPEPPKPRAPSISRTDTGRFSVRGSKTSHATPTSRPNQKSSSKDYKKSTRSNSTLTSKEVEFQNWKRRKSYDPMKAAAEGKKKADGPKKQHSVENGSSSRDNSVLRSASFHGTRGTLSLADDWSDNELDFNQRDAQAPPPSSPQLGSDSDLETASYLQTTHNVMSAMSARINVYNPVDSGGESDEDTSHSFRQATNKITRDVSDTETSDEPQAAAQSPITNTKYNRTFSLRRGRLEPQEAKPSNIATTKAKTVGASGAKGKTETVPSISRTDSGRFSMRLTKTVNISKLKPKETKKQTSNSREVEMQNWKRRKSYDPMKAAMEGKRKAGLAKRNVNDNSSSSDRK
ncbi:uncharacterized protein [Venturia canescens]|uniref:uncharacterized protein isoform X2 n=1 Tax=Venturia canescens TaxID=32260 RepID=UPI001C9CB744|nr:uncharacterized protein LOC122414399 isoform X2 [Venturia canescens]XP_043281575.1 uncharacterized protein LOC122414399 isoform X2 [Venturia canescens]